MTAIRHGCTLATAGKRLFVNGERHLRSARRLRAYPAGCSPPASLSPSVAVSTRPIALRYPAELVLAGQRPEQLRPLSEAGARQRWPSGIPETVATLLEKELRLIAELKYEHFFSPCKTWSPLRGSAEFSVRGAARRPTPPSATPLALPK
jgi:error-prone DNA polymerase